MLGWYHGVEHFYLTTHNPQIALFPQNVHYKAGGNPLSVYVGDSSEFEVHLFDRSGQLKRIIRDLVPASPISDEDIKWERWAFLSWGETTGMVREFKQIADATPIPDRKPAFEDLVVDSEGFLWVKEYSSHRPQRVPYRVFSPDGVRQGVIHLPGRVKVFEIGADYILGIEKDLNDVEAVVLFEMSRRPSI